MQQLLVTRQVTTTTKKAIKVPWYRQVKDSSFVDAILSEKKPNTLRNIAIGIRGYKQWKEQESGKKLIYNDLLPEINEENGTPLFKSLKQVKRDITAYHTHLLDSHISYPSRNVAHSGIVRFYKGNDIPFGYQNDTSFWEIIRTKFFPLDQIPVANAKGWEPKHVKMMLRHADVKEKPMMFLMYVTALRIGALCILKLGHLKKVLLPDRRYIYRVGPLRFKTNMWVFPFTTPETTRYIDEYLEERTEAGEMLDYGEAVDADEDSYDSSSGRPFFNPDTGAPLFRNDNRLSTKTDEQIANPQPIPYSSVGGVIRSVIKHTPGLAKEKIPVNHGFKKGGLTMMAKAKGKDIEKQKIITGHTIGVRKSYIDYSEQDLLQEYMLYLENLTVGEEEKLRVELYTEKALRREDIAAIGKRIDDLEKFRDERK